MKYAIFYLLKGEAKKYRDKLVREVGPRFGERYVLDSKLPAHVTLKTPFITKDIIKIENLLREFSKKHKSQEIEITGFGNFNEFVTFLKFNFPEPAKKIQKELIKELTGIKEVNIKKHDKIWHPHATISYGNTEKSFKNIWNYLGKLDKPYFKLKFDNLTIMKKQGKYWKIYREFKLK